MGEAMARMEIFFFIVCLLQRFHLELESENAPNISEECAKSVNCSFMYSFIELVAVLSGLPIVSKPRDLI